MELSILDKLNRNISDEILQIIRNIMLYINQDNFSKLSIIVINAVLK